MESQNQSGTGFNSKLSQRIAFPLAPLRGKLVVSFINRIYDFILDKSEGITVMFADPKLDKSDDVLRELGVK